MRLFLATLALVPLLTGCLTGSLSRIIKSASRAGNNCTNKMTLHVHSPVYGDLNFTWNIDPNPAVAATSPFPNPVQGGAVMILPPNAAVLPTPEGGVIIQPKPSYR